jgi:hypothetical protein
MTKKFEQIEQSGAENLMDRRGFLGVAAGVLALGSSGALSACGDSGPGGNTEISNAGCMEGSPEKPICSQEAFYWCESPGAVTAKITAQQNGRSHDFAVTVDTAQDSFVVRETYVSAEQLSAAGFDLNQSVNFQYSMQLPTGITLREDRIWDYETPLGVGQIFSGVPENNGRGLPKVFFDHPFDGEGRGQPLEAAGSTDLAAGLLRFTTTEQPQLSGKLNFTLTGFDANQVKRIWLKAGGQTYVGQIIGNNVEVDLPAGYQGEVAVMAEFMPGIAEADIQNLRSVVTPQSVFTQMPTSDLGIVHCESVHNGYDRPPGVSYAGGARFEFVPVLAQPGRVSRRALLADLLSCLA